MGSLFLVRHATTRASEAGVNLGQHNDAPLTEAGTQLATRTGRAIHAEIMGLGLGPMRLLSSPARRCRQTAEAIAAALGGPRPELVVEDGLWEIDYGAWEGLTAEECRLRDPQLRSRWESDPYHTSTPAGESGRDVATRAFATLAPLEEWLAAGASAAAVVVTHNHVVRLRLMALLGLSMPDYRRRVVADPGAYSVVTFAADRPAIRRINVLPVELPPE